MADIGTMTGRRPDLGTSPEGGGDPGRTIRRARTLPGSRAVVGALLVTASAVGVFAAYLDATATPDTRYVVVRDAVPIGTVLTDELLADTTRFGLLAIDLPDMVAANAIPAGRTDELAGQRTSAPLAAGDLLARSALTRAPAADDTVALTLELELARAVGGSLEPGERVDVAATHGSGADTVTSYVARRALLTDVVPLGGGIGGDAVMLTLALPDDQRVLDVIEAANTGQVVVTRAAAMTGDGTDEEG